MGKPHQMNNCCMGSPIIAKFYSALISFKIINKFKKLRNKLF